MKNITIKKMTLVGLMTALTCVLGPFSIPLPFSPVPLSLTMLAIFFSLYVIGMKLGTLSTLLYLLIGLVGLPVFSNFSGGAGKLLGPTGGYLIGFIFMALIAGFFIDKWPNHLLLGFLGMVLGTAVCYAFGTAWLAYQNHLTLKAALAAAVIPFIPGDIIKMVIAVTVGPIIRKALKKAGLI